MVRVDGRKVPLCGRKEKLALWSWGGCVIIGKNEKMTEKIDAIFGIAGGFAAGAAAARGAGRGPVRYLDGRAKIFRTGHPGR